MTASTNNALPSDEELVAFLDGELPLENRRRVNGVLASSAEARRRLESLRNGDRPFREAFDLLAHEAPMDRLSAMLRRADSDVRPDSKAAAPAPATDNRAGMAAAAAILLALAGGFAGGMLFRPTDASVPAPQAAAEPAPRGWRQAVADYQSLFTTDSLTPYQGGDSGLELASAKVGLPLEKLAGDTGDLNFRRVQVLNFNGKPLAQFAYLSADGTPVSLCIIRSGNKSAPADFETRNQLGIVHWIANGFGYMVIGDMPRERLQDVAEQFRLRLPA